MLDTAETSPTIRWLHNNASLAVPQSPFHCNNGESLKHPNLGIFWDMLYTAHENNVWVKVHLKPRRRENGAVDGDHCTALISGVTCQETQISVFIAVRTSKLTLLTSFSTLLGQNLNFAETPCYIYDENDTEKDTHPPPSA